MCFTACGFVKEKYLGSSPDSSAYFLYVFTHPCEGGAVIIYYSYFPNEQIDPEVNYLV